ncbi:hypothetical protein DERF_016712 [Dermatophagoides farinae]|uniref:Uncharacterized protein n=1 Tax=Dermatophagoides farinae TaxID=6954 RepID=A0A922KVL3_DERFA|nr:hypothetical protein DERF_016712 [Dermatophagoides farinae]
MRHETLLRKNGKKTKNNNNNNIEWTEIISVIEKSLVFSKDKIEIRVQEWINFVLNDDENCEVLNNREKLARLRMITLSFI